MGKRLLFALACIVLGQSLNAQVTVGTPDYEHQKANGTLDQNQIIPYVVPPKNSGNAVKPKPQQGTPKSGCQCYIQPDASYTVANFGFSTDDGSQGPIAIPFNFCLYGTTYNSFYININGNITFDAPYGTFSSVPFPSNQYVMIAPFWGDVDLGGTGTIYYKITPTAVYINWEAVGYYNSQVDKVNTFQLIITDGTDPAVPNGDNIAFCYGDMQWTTGAASGGTGGFGGTPATVGVNKGDGIDFIQLGRFDQPGAAYDGPAGANDGVDWLDNQSFYFNVCSATNIPPIFGDFGIGGSSGVSGGNNCVGGDTISICGVGNGDTLILNPSFLAPESGETVTVTANFNGMTNASVISSSPGNPGSAGIMIVGDPSNAGYNVIDIIATDDGSPVQTTTVSITIFVDLSGTVTLNPIVLGDTVSCDDVTLELADAYTYDSYEWSIIPSDSTMYTDTSGAFWVTVQDNGCIKSVLRNVLIVDPPVPAVMGNLYVCAGDSTLISLDPGSSQGLPYDSLSWNGGAMDTVTQDYFLAGTHSLSVIDTNGCQGTTNFTITSSAALSLTNDINQCNQMVTVLPPGTNQGETGGSWTFNGPAGATVDFNPANSIDPIITVDTLGSYEFIYTDPCGDMDTLVITYGQAPILELTDTFFCSESFPAYLIDPDTTYYSSINSYVWNTGQTTETISVTDTGYYEVTATNACGTATAGINISSLVFEFPDDTSVCGLAFVFGFNEVNTTGGGTWTWTGAIGDTLTFVPGTNVETPTVYANNNGTYELTFTDNLCGVSKTMEIEFKTLAWVGLADDTACLNVPYELNAYGPQNTSWLWSTGSTSQSISVTQSGVYSVTVANECNSYTDTAVIVLEPCTCNIPNVITPNSDGVNDAMYIDCVESYSSTTLQVFNRWGTKVYEKENYDNSWYGTNAAGDALADGTYYYIFIVNDNGDVYKGHLTVFNR